VHTATQHRTIVAQTDRQTQRPAVAAAAVFTIASQSASRSEPVQQGRRENRLRFTSGAARCKNPPPHKTLGVAGQRGGGEGDGTASWSRGGGGRVDGSGRMKGRRQGARRGGGTQRTGGLIDRSEWGWRGETTDE